MRDVTRLNPRGTSKLLVKKEKKKVGYQVLYHSTISYHLVVKSQKNWISSTFIKNVLLFSWYQTPVPRVVSLFLNLLIWPSSPLKTTNIDLMKFSTAHRTRTLIHMYIFLNLSHLSAA